MPCPKNIITRKFLWWKWEEEGPHDSKIFSITKFMDCSEHFTVIRYCSVCRCGQTQHFVEMEQLIREGFEAKDLKEIKRFGGIYPKYN